MTGPDERLSEQLEYYRARAPEYDRWFRREGRYDRGPEFRARWEAELDEVRRALLRTHPAGRVLEIACGTGLWTMLLARHADRVVALDLAPEMLVEARRRIDQLPRRPRAAVDLVEADVFSWTPPEPFDAVFIGFFLSHVPPELFETFWRRVRSFLVPGGRFFLVDSLREDTSTAGDHRLPPEGSILARRRLDDGREFRVVKVFHDPEDLERRLAGLGFAAKIERTATFFIHGSGSAGEGRTDAQDG